MSEELWWIEAPPFWGPAERSGLARRKLNLDKAELDRLGVLVHGAYGVGKTHFEGDFLRWAVKQGKKARFISIIGEDGHKTLKGMGLGELGEEVTTPADFNTAVAEAATDKVEALAVDSLPAYANMVLRSFFQGELRYPDPTKDGQRAVMLWGQLKMLTMGAVLRTREAVPFVLWVSAHDKGEDPIQGGGKTITPDMVGKQALGCIGWFDAVMHLRAQTVGPNKVRRWLEVAPSEQVATRQRFPNVITEDIPVPEKEGGWEAFYQRVQKAMGA
jgi:hypothetical protein